MEDSLSSTNNKFRNAGSKYDNHAYNYIKNIVLSTSIIFDSSVSIDNVSKAIYENLIYEKCTDYDIVKNKCGEKILKYIIDKYFGINFNNEFNEIYDYIRNATNIIFNQTKQRIRNEGYNPSVYYDDRVEKNKIAFSIAYNVYVKKLNVKDLYKSGELNSMIRERIRVDMFKKNSTSKKAISKAMYEEKKYHVMDYDTFKKLVIGALILFGIAGLSYKKNDTNTNKSTYTPPKNQYVEQKTPDEEGEIIRGINKDTIDIRIIQKIIDNTDRGHVRGED